MYNPSQLLVLVEGNSNNYDSVHELIESVIFCSMHGEGRKTEEKKGVVPSKKKYRNTGTKGIKASSKKRARKKTTCYNDIQR